MDEFEPQKKEKIFTKSFISRYLYIFILGIVVLFGSSYSLTFFVQNKKIATGSLKTAALTIDFTDRNINATSLSIPTSDKEGLKEFVKNLVIENTAQVDGKVKVTLDRTSGLNLTDLRYALLINGTIIKIDDVPSNGVILETAIFSGETINVEVRLWPKTTYSGTETTFNGTLTPEIRYLGTVASSYSDLTNKYVNFNCTGNTCEKWRIVKVEDGRLVLTREADLEGATSRTNSNRFDSTQDFNDSNDLVTSLSTDNKNVYLAKTVKINGGKGTVDEPYILVNNNYSNQDEKVIAIITYDNDGETSTQPVYYNKTNYISQEVDDEEGFQGWTDNTNDYVLGDTVTFTTDTTLTAIIKQTLNAKITQLCNDSSIDYVKPYTQDLGTTMDTYDGRGTKNVCYYTSTTEDNLAGQNGNVLFGGYCWQIIRTTDVGGVKLLYNGKAENNQCLTTRTADIGVIGSTGTQYTTLSGDKLYGAKFEIFDDSGTNKFRLLDTNTYNWSDSTYQNIIGKYVCGTSSSPTGTADTCEVMYYVGHYQSATQASTEKYTIGTQAHYSQIGTSSYNAYSDSPALVGYMYNTTYNYKSKSFTTSSNIINYDLTGATTAYFYGDKATWNSSTNMYDLTVDDGSGNDITPTTTLEWQNIRSTAQGMYTCRSATATSCTEVYYIVANMTNTYMPSVKLSNGETIDAKTITVGTGYTESGGNYTLTGMSTLLLKDWYSNPTENPVRTNANQKYICSDFTSSTCSTIYYITSNDNYRITYNTSVNNYYFGNSVTYQNGSYTIDTNTDTTKYQQIWDWYKKYNTISNSHYTCFNAIDNTCGSSVYYVYYTQNGSAYYIELKNSKTVEDALKEMLNYKQNSTDTDEDINKYNSSIKGIVDNFYETKLSSTAKTFLDTSAVFCNDRSVRAINGWNVTGDSTTNYLYFNQSSSNRNLTCANVTDRFSTENEDAELAYPIGLLSEPERYLMYSYYTKTGQTYWGLSPNSFRSNAGARVVYSTGGSSIYNVFVSYGARVSVSLRPDVEISGEGTYANPYVVVGSN